jgi:hypothetical protein
MKFQTLSFILIIVTAASCYKKPEQPTEIPVTKTIQFKIGKVNDYTAPGFNGLKVELKLSVAKESLVDGRVLAAWDTTFSLRSIHDFPVIASPLTITKQFNPVWQSNQTLRVSRVIKYVTATNQVSQSAFGETIPVSVNEKQVTVNL